MSGSYHDAIKKCLLDIGEELTKHKKTRFRQSVDGDSKQIPIVYMKKRGHTLVRYQPDAYFKTGHGQYFVFEILDAEGDNDVLADILQTMIMQNSNAMFFIAPTQKRVQEAIDLYKLTWEILSDRYNADWHEFPWIDGCHISREDAKNSTRSRKAILKMLKPYFSEYGSKQ